MELKMKALSPKIGAEIPVPAFATVGSAAMDLRACIDADVTIAAGQRAIIPTGIAIALPGADYVALICARSGLASKQGLRPANCVGVCDSDYRGEYIVMLHNDTDQPRTIENGDRIAQLVVMPYLSVSFTEVEELSETGRGDGGFGSTGR